MAVSEEQSSEIVAPKEDDHKYLGGIKLFTTMFSISLVGFLMLLDTSVIATAIPRITSEFHSLNDVGWYGTSYLLANCAVQPLTGKIYTHFSNKWGFLTFFGIFELGSLLCGAAANSDMLIVGRAVAGLGGSGLLSGGYTIVHAAVPLQKQPLYLGILLGVCQLGLLCGPLIGGALTQYASWRWCFYINLPCGGIIGILLLFITLPDHSSKDVSKKTLASKLGQLDLIGFSLFAPAAIQFILALQWGGVKYAWSSATVIGLFCGAFGTLLVFLAWEYYKGDDAMIPFSIIKKRAIWSSCLNYGCLVGSMFGSTYYLPIYFQAVRNATPTMSGVDLLPTILSTMLFSGLTGGLVGRVGYYVPFAVGSGILNTIGSGLLTTLTPTTGMGMWIGYQILQGSGRGMGFQMPIIAAQNNSPKEQVSIASAIVVFSQNLGGVVFLSLSQVIFSDRLRHGLARHAPEVDPETVIIAGATAVRSAVPAASLPGVLLAYNEGFVHVMYLATGAAAGAFLFAFGMGWKNIKTAKAAETTTEEKA